VEARRTLQGLGLGSTKIYAKLETRQALLNLKDILSEVGACARGRGGAQGCVGGGRVLGRLQGCLQRRQPGSPAAGQAPPVQAQLPAAPVACPCVAQPGATRLACWSQPAACRLQADGLVLSRGNLGLDCLPEKMALIQKAIIQYCNIVGDPLRNVSRRRCCRCGMLSRDVLPGARSCWAEGNLRRLPARQASAPPPPSPSPPPCAR
jgi:hypothetical protein